MSAAGTGKTFFGHPHGLATLFFTEMWERFSYYGMRALLFLYMVTGLAGGGMGFDEETAGAIYGLYTMLVYLMALPGGWVADNILGLRQSVFYGGCLITLGHICLAFPNIEMFFTGLFFIVLGTGLLKPNISSLVGELYPANEHAKRDAGFSLFYMGINIGAFVSPFITGYLGEYVNWHYGFAVAGLGMIAGLVYYKLTEHRLQHVGSNENIDPSSRKSAVRILIIVFLCAITLVMLLVGGIIAIDPVAVAKASVMIIGVSTALYFFYLLVMAKLTREERNGVATIAIFFLTSVIFYIGYEQQGSSLNLFAKRYTNMFLGSFEMPASWMQTVPPITVILFAPLAAWLWIWLSRRKVNLLTPHKLAIGVLFIGVSFIVMAGAALVYRSGHKPLPTWLMLTYLFQTFGEICLYPVGLSAVTKLAPRKYLGQMMGVWFLSLSLGNLIAGMLAGQLDADKISSEPGSMVTFFIRITILTFVAGALVLAASPWLGRLMRRGSK
jgi:POT family proton-dependent oligopeptide transporter